VQAKLWPANLRILHPVEAGNNAGLDGTQSLVIIGFESADVPQGENVRVAVAIAREFGGIIADDNIVIDDGKGNATGHEGPVGAWRNAFIGVNAGLTAGLGLLADTFETATTWDNWPEFDWLVRERVGRVLKETMGDSAMLSCRFTHVYPDGPAPYYSFSGVVRRGGEAEVWRQIKDEATAVLVDAGGTVTHHHAVGRMHAEGWADQRPALFGDVLKSVKRTLDPNGILNPGVLFKP
jgi:alkyldihydroxyacetonephosphate synthase